MDQAELIWMNGELVAWEDAKVHVLTHCLHYGTGVFEGDARLRRPSRGRRSSATSSTSTGCSSRPSSTTCRSRTAARRSAPRRTKSSRSNNLPSCYIRPIVFRGAGPMGLNPLDAPIDVAIAAWPWGAYLGEEGEGARRAREGLQLAAHQRATR